MAKGIAIFDYQICMACTACSLSCPFDCIHDTKIGLDVYKKAYPELKPDHHCTGCGLCVKACPVECISIQG
ncbi:MAG: hypothetical protein CVU39_16215 [Chloroflexi bacterium HGW-Chloroflexi-10]|nr:MAG: hypothetical protein CVU39_16215 [Chloroflexi bacterium HGW-Chloroflexi-10]